MLGAVSVWCLSSKSTLLSPGCGHTSNAPNYVSCVPVTELTTEPCSAEVTECDDKHWLSINHLIRYENRRGSFWVLAVVQALLEIESREGRFSSLCVMERLLVGQERQTWAQELVSMAFVMHGTLEVQEEMVEFKWNMVGAGKGTIWEGFVE